LFFVLTVAKFVQLRFQGVLENYNNLDNLWKIDASNVTTVVGETEVTYERARFLFTA
jgi:hypothetical protein